MPRGETFTATEVEILRETDNAILLKTVTDDEVWIPLSQVEEIRRYPDGAPSEVVMSLWIAQKKGLA